jgi:hypothetical protein
LTYTSPSLQAAASLLPSFVQASARTQPLNPSSFITMRAVSTDHRRMLQSAPAVAMILPSGEKRTQSTCSNVTKMQQRKGAIAYPIAVACGHVVAAQVLEHQAIIHPPHSAAAVYSHAAHEAAVEGREGNACGGGGVKQRVKWL